MTIEHTQAGISGSGVLDWNDTGNYMANIGTATSSVKAITGSDATTNTIMDPVGCNTIHGDLA